MEETPTRQVIGRLAHRRGEPRIWAAGTLPAAGQLSLLGDARRCTLTEVSRSGPRQFDPECPDRAQQGGIMLLAPARGERC
ncbi:MAG: hypothetical protein ACRD0K_12160 [Egibacteraceae bacterium]